MLSPGPMSSESRHAQPEHRATRTLVVALASRPCSLGPFNWPALPSQARTAREPEQPPLLTLTMSCSVLLCVQEPSSHHLPCHGSKDGGNLQKNHVPSSPAPVQPSACGGHLTFLPRLSATCEVWQVCPWRKPSPRRADMFPAPALGQTAPSSGSLVNRRGELSSHMEGGKSLPRCQEVGPTVPRAPGPESFPISRCPGPDGQS